MRSCDRGCGCCSRPRTTWRSSASRASSRRRPRCCASRTPAVVLLDLHMGRDLSLSALFELRSASPSTAVVILTMDDDPAFVAPAWNAGAAGLRAQGGLAHRPGTRDPHGRQGRPVPRSGDRRVGADERRQRGADRARARGTRDSSRSGTRTARSPARCTSARARSRLTAPTSRPSSGSPAGRSSFATRSSTASSTDEHRRRARAKQIEFEAAQRRVVERLRATAPTRPSPPAARGDRRGRRSLLFAIAFSARLAIDDPDALLANFYIVPIAVLAIEFGTRGRADRRRGRVRARARVERDQHVHVDALGYVSRGPRSWSPAWSSAGSRIGSARTSPSGRTPSATSRCTPISSRGRTGTWRGASSGSRRSRRSPGRSGRDRPRAGAVADPRPWPGDRVGPDARDLPARRRRARRRERER